MDLSVRKQPQQQSPAPPSRPILNPAVPINLSQGSINQNSSPVLPSTHNSIPQPQQQQQIKQQPQQQYVSVPQQRLPHQSKYAQLLHVIEEMGKDIKPTYAGNKNSVERLRRAIASARVLVRECQLECDRNNRP